MMDRWMKVFKDMRFYNIYLLLVSLLIVFFSIYLRLFLVRKQYTLTELKLNVGYLQISIYVLFILFHAAIILYAIYKIYLRYMPKVENKMSSKIVIFFSKIINNLYWKPLEYLHDLIAPDLPYSGYLMLKYIDFFGQLGSFKIIKIIAVIFVYIPRLVVVLLFTTELIFYNKIHYFLYCLPLLILPNIYHVFLKFCESLCERNLPIVEEDLVVVPKGSPALNGIQTQFTFTLNPQIATNDPSFDSSSYFQDLTYHWLRFYELRLVTSAVKTFFTKYDPYISLICSVLYCLTGLYKLWYIFF